MSILKETRIGKVKTRMGPALLNIVEDLPPFAAAALWVQFKDVADATEIAYTDGKTVYAGDLYEQLLKKDPATGNLRREGEFVTVHELTHVMLAHPARTRIMRERDPQGFDPKTWNVATDAIINATICGATSRYHQPEGTIDLVETLKEIGALKGYSYGTKSQDIVREWSSERLYAAIKQHLKETGKSIDDLLGQMGDNGSAKDKKVGKHLCGDVHESSEGIDKARKDVQEWAQRANQTFGSLPKFKERLVLELPKVETPWERALQQYLLRYGRGQQHVDFARPHRRWLALEHDMRVREHIDLPYAAAYGKTKKGRVAVALDSSGSTEEILPRFLAEVARAMSQTDLELRLIVCDAAVHEIHDLHGFQGRQRLKQLKYSGGGGTDFRPAFAAAAEFKPDLLIYFTDLAGAFPAEEPRFPVLWAVPEQYAEGKYPFGKLLALK